MRIISKTNQKGGVGKTTATINLGGALAALGRRVALVDLDPQGHLTDALGISDEILTSPHNLAGLMLGHSQQPLHQMLQPIRENLWVIPTHEDMIGLEPQMYAKTGRERLLGRALEQLAAPPKAPVDNGLDDLAIDYVLIDCPPSLGALTDSALVAARSRPADSAIQGLTLIPVQSEHSIHKALRLLLRQIAELEDSLGIEIPIGGLIINAYDSRRGKIVTTTNTALHALSSSDNPTLKTLKVRATLGDLKELRESWAYKQTVVDYAPESPPAKVFMDLAKWLDGRW